MPFWNGTKKPSLGKRDGWGDFGSLLFFFPFNFNFENQKERKKKNIYYSYYYFLLSSLATQHIENCQKLPAGTEPHNSKSKPISDLTKLSPSEKKILIATHKAIQRVTSSMTQDFAFNVAIAELMKLSNTLEESDCKDSAGFFFPFSFFFPPLPNFSKQIQSIWWMFPKFDQNAGTHGSPYHVWNVAWPCVFSPSFFAQTKVLLYSFFLF